MFDRLLKNNEVLKSFHDGIEEKMASPIYGVFLITWLVFHWELVYTAFFVNEEKIWQATGGVLKNDYLREKYFDFSDPLFYVLMAAPFLLTWLIIWKFPGWIAHPAFKKAQEDAIEKYSVKVEAQKRMFQMETAAIEALGNKVEAEKQLRKEEKEIENIDPTIVWADELKTVAVNEKNILAIREGVRAVYQTNGRFTSNLERVNAGYNSYISSDSLARLDSMGLIKFLSDGRNVIEFSEKGRFFVRNLQERNAL